MLAHGATEVLDLRGQWGPGSGWVVLADPEGNEFCLLRSQAERDAARPSRRADGLDLRGPTDMVTGVQPSEGTEALVTPLPATGTPPALSGIGYDDSTWDRPWNLARGQVTTAERMPSVELDPGGPARPIPRGPPSTSGR